MELGEKYIYDVYKEKGFKKAAEKNFISQASLSATVKKTENKLGFLVFDRSQFPIVLTPQGKIYIQHLEDTAESERIMKQRIAALSKPVTNTICVGGTSFFARKLLPEMCKIFHDKFPETELRIDLGEMYFYSHLLDKLDAGNLDFVIGYVHDEEKHSVIPLKKERYIIAAKKDLPGIKPLLSYSLSKEELFSGKNFSNKQIRTPDFFKGVNFVDIGTNSVLRTAVGGIVDSLSYSSCYVHGTRKNDIYYELMLSGIGAVITTDFTASCFDDSGDVAFFLLDIKNKYRDACIIYKKDTPLSHNMQEFVDVARQVALS